MEDKDITLADYFEKWMEVHKKPHIDPETYRKYEFNLKIIKEYYQNTKLSKITATMHQQVLNKLAERYVRYTVKLFNSHIRSAIKIALHQGTLKKDFTQLAKIFSNVESKNENEKYLELDEYRTLLLDVRKSVKYQSHFFIYTVGKTGLRFSEALGLTTLTIDRENMLLQVLRTYKVYGRKIGWNTTKNSQSVRDVPIDKEWLTAYDEYMEVGYIDNPEKRLFTKVSSTAANKVLKKKTRPTFTIHGLRHTYVSFLIYNDLDVMTISKLVDHKDTTETLRTYAHLFEEKQTKNFDKVRSLFEEFGANLGRT